jgi:hypothetical protein
MSNDSQNDKRTADGITRRGGYAGAIIAFLIAVASMLLFNWADSRSHQENNLEALTVTTLTAIILSTMVTMTLLRNVLTGI